MVKPTILFVHGAWHTPEHMQPMRNILEAEGYPTACPVLPSVDPKPPTMDLYDDAKAIQVELSRLVEDEGRIVIVLMHSYGGVVGSEAVHCRFAKKYRESKGLQGGVIYLFCMCAFVVKLDSTVLETFGGVIPDTVMKMEVSDTSMHAILDSYNRGLSPTDTLPLSHSSRTMVLAASSTHPFDSLPTSQRTNSTSGHLY